MQVPGCGMSVIAEGSFGRVFKTTHKGDVVACKRVRHSAEHGIDPSTIRELLILRRLSLLLCHSCHQIAMFVFYCGTFVDN